jgi:HEAT repeat protein
MRLAYPSIGAAALCLVSVAFSQRSIPAELTLPRDGWTSWQVAAVDSAPDWCCWSNHRSFRDMSRAPCRLDSNQDGFGSRDHETTDAVRVYARTAGGKIDRFRVLSVSCPVETAAPVRDLGTIAQDESARWLIDLAKRRDDDDVLAALAINRGDLARDALAGIARSHARDETRKHAIFWLATLRGQEGADVTSSLMFSDKDAEVREHAAFALGQSKSPRAAADLIRLGNTDKVGEVRAQAWFWLADTQAPEVEQAILAALRKETDEDVCDRAIHALSRLPNERGTRALIATAEDQSLSRELRKRAVFWLSQSEHDSAQVYLEQILSAR